MNTARVAELLRELAAELEAGETPDAVSEVRLRPKLVRPVVKPTAEDLDHARKALRRRGLRA